MLFRTFIMVSIIALATGLVPAAKPSAKYTVDTYFGRNKVGLPIQYISFSLED